MSGGGRLTLPPRQFLKAFAPPTQTASSDRGRGPGVRGTCATPRSGLASFLNLSGSRPGTLSFWFLAGCGPSAPARARLLQSDEVPARRSRGPTPHCAGATLEPRARRRPRRRGSAPGCGPRFRELLPPASRAVLRPRGKEWEGPRGPHEGP